MTVITQDEVFEYWPKKLDDSGVESRLNRLYGAAKRNGLSISQDYNAFSNEDRNGKLIDCLKNYFQPERFVILTYDSWIMKRLIEIESGVVLESLGDVYLDFWAESTLQRPNMANEWSFEDGYITTKKRRTARNFATDPYCKRCKERKKKREALDNCCKAYFPSPQRLIAAFSESKIWIGFGHNDPFQLASLITASGPVIPIPCFSWSRGSGFSNPGNDCLAPWAKFSSFSTPNYDPKQAIELFRELIVRCTIKSMKKYSLHNRSQYGS